MSLGQSIRTGVKWIVLGNTGNQILQFCFGIILARLLFPEDFGLMLTIQVFTGFVSMISSGGMGQSLIRAKTVSDADFHVVFTLQLAIGILVYIGFFLLAPTFAVYFENPSYTDLMRVATIFFLLKPFRNMHSSWLTREMDFKSRAVISVVTGLLGGISSILMALAGMGVWSLALSGLLVAICQNILLARVTPLTPRLNFDSSLFRRHGTYGSKILAIDILARLREESIKLILSKLAGPAFLGLFNKADSLSRKPYEAVGGAVNQTVFRAMSKVQDDLDQTKYMFYRSITLLMVYVLPLYIGLWWVAEPFIGVVYGEKWLPSAEPLKILSMAGFFYIIYYPCGVVLMAQNRLTQELTAQIVNLVFAVTACLIGLQWGLKGVAWGVLASQVVFFMNLYLIVYRTILTRFTDLVKAVFPGIIMNILLFLVLAFTNHLLGGLRLNSPAIYLLIMLTIGTVFYLIEFLFLPITTLNSEASRWRKNIMRGLIFLK